MLAPAPRSYISRAPSGAPTTDERAAAAVAAAEQARQAAATAKAQERYRDAVANYYSQTDYVQDKAEAEREQARAERDAKVSAIQLQRALSASPEALKGVRFTKNVAGAQLQLQRAQAEQSAAALARSTRTRTLIDSLAEDTKRIFLPGYWLKDARQMSNAERTAHAALDIATVLTFQRGVVAAAKASGKAAGSVVSGAARSAAAARAAKASENASLRIANEALRSAAGTKAAGASARLEAAIVRRDANAIRAAAEDLRQAAVAEKLDSVAARADSIAMNADEIVRSQSREAFRSATRQRGALFLESPRTKIAKPPPAKRRVEVAERPTVDLGSVNSQLSTKSRGRIADAFETLRRAAIERAEAVEEAAREVSSLRIRKPQQNLPVGGRPKSKPSVALEPFQPPKLENNALMLETAGATQVGRAGPVTGTLAQFVRTLSPESRRQLATAVADHVRQSGTTTARFPVVLAPARGRPSPAVVGYVEVNPLSADDLERLPLTALERQAILKVQAKAAPTDAVGTTPGGQYRLGLGLSQVPELAAQTKTETASKAATATRVAVAEEVATRTEEQPKQTFRRLTEVSRTISPRTGRRPGVLAEVDLPEGPSRSKKYPDVFAYRQGSTEIRVRRRGPLQFGADLSREVPNDPKTKPWDSIVVESHGPRPIKRRESLGFVDLDVKALKLRFLSKRTKL